MTALLIVEDNALFAQTLVQFLGRFDSFTVVGLASSAEAALAQLPTLHPDLVLVDVSLPGMNGIELAGELCGQYPDLPCLMLSGHHDQGYVQRALAAGARGYVLKENPLDLLAAVPAVLAGEIYLSAELRR